MENKKWMEDPAIAGISNEKLEILTKIVENSDGLDAKQLIPYFIKSSNEAEKDGVVFSDTETNAILNVLMADISPEEKKRVNTVRKLADMISKKKQKK